MVINKTLLDLAHHTYMTVYNYPSNANRMGWIRFRKDVERCGLDLDEWEENNEVEYDVTGPKFVDEARRLGW